MTAEFSRLTERSRKVLEHSLREALSLGHNYVGTEHLLLGLVRERDGIASQALADLGVSASDVRDAIIRRLSGPRAKAATAEDALVERIAQRVLALIDERAAA